MEPNNYTEERHSMVTPCKVSFFKGCVKQVMGVTMTAHVYGDSEATLEEVNALIKSFACTHLANIAFALKRKCKCTGRVCLGKQSGSIIVRLEVEFPLKHKIDTPNVLDLVETVFMTPLKRWIIEYCEIGVYPLEVVEMWDFIDY